MQLPAPVIFILFLILRSFLPYFFQQVMLMLTYVMILPQVDLWQ